ncbi:MAG: glycosyltransferase family 2 protein [Clostridia bacterium]|nr:glycosyltransferase family 2 protein [Clostridia bacterium]
MTLADVVLAVFTLDEERALPWVLWRARELGVRAVVVDGGSVDGTLAVASAFGAPVVRAPRGKGRALRAFLASEASAGRAVALVDGDATYDVADLPRLVAAGGDMAIAWRRPVGVTAMPFARGVGNRAFAWAVRAATGRACPDPLSGFRVIRRGALAALLPKAEGFELELELTLSFLRAGLDVRWVPVPYHPRIGRSKLRPVADGARIARTLLSLRP